MQDGQKHDGSVFNQNIDGCLESAIGKYGLSRSQYESWLNARRSPRRGAERRLPQTIVSHYSASRKNVSDIAEAEAALARFSDGANTLVFFGTGGSGLGGQTLAQLAGWKIPGVASEAQRARPRTRFYDNLDGGTLEGVLKTLDLADVTFHRHVQIGRHGGNAGAGHRDAFGRQGGRPRSANPEALSRHHRTGASPAKPTASGRCWRSSASRCSNITRASAAGSRV